MRNNIWKILVVFLVLSFTLNQNIDLQKDTKHTSHLGLSLTSPKYSPNGKYILATSSKYAGLYVINSSDFSLHKTFFKNENVGYGACWSANSEELFFRKKEGYTFYTFSVNIKTGETKKTTLNPQYLTTKGFNGEAKNLAYINENRQLFYINDKQKETQITSDNNNYYHLVMNPKSNYFVVHKGSEIILVDVLSGTNKVIGQGIANAISKDNRYVFYHIDSSTDGHHISNSEIYVYDIELSKITQLTHTSKDIELWAELSSDNNTLLYSNERTGELESIKINY